MSTSTLMAMNLAKSYGSRQVIKDVSLRIESGQIIGLLGPNGAGKTTCFYMIVGLVRPDSGKLLIDDQNIAGLPMHKRAQYGLSYLAQEASIFRKLTTAENIMAILQTRNDLDKQGRINALDTLLEEFQIGHIKDSQGISLSGGERRRVEIARSLATDPKFILLDEPFAGVDPISVIEIQKIIKHLKDRGIGVLITDHNVRETLQICESAYILDQGTILVEGTPETIVNHPIAKSNYLGEDFSL